MAKSCKEGTAANRRRSGLKGLRFESRCQQGLFAVEPLLVSTKPRRFFRRDLIFLCFASRGGAGREFPGSKIQIFSRQPCLGEENFDFFSRQPFPGEENFDFFLAMARNWLILAGNWVILARN